MKYSLNSCTSVVDRIYIIMDSAKLVNKSYKNNSNIEFFLYPEGFLYSFAEMDDDSSVYKKE